MMVSIPANVTIMLVMAIFLHITVKGISDEVYFCKLSFFYSDYRGNGSVYKNNSLVWFIAIIR